MRLRAGRGALSAVEEEGAAALHEEVAVLGGENLKPGCAAGVRGGARRAERGCGAREQRGRRRAFQLFRMAAMLLRRSVASSNGRWKPLPCGRRAAYDQCAQVRTGWEGTGARCISSFQGWGWVGARHEVKGALPRQVDVAAGVEHGRGVAVAEVAAEDLRQGPLRGFAWEVAEDWVAAEEQPRCSGRGGPGGRGPRTGLPTPAHMRSSAA